MIARNLLLCAALLTLAACSDNTPGTDTMETPAEVTTAARGEAPSLSASEALTYSEDGQLFLNDLFGLQIEKPEGWFSQNAEDMLAMQQQSLALMSDDNTRAMIRSALESTLPLFGFFEVPPGSPGKLNPNILGSAENIRLAPGIVSGCDYLAHARQALRMMQVNYEIDEQCGQHEVNGTEFDYFEAQAMFGPQLVKQRYLALVRDGYAIVVVLSFFDEESEARLNEVLATLRMQ